jgi:hypothetical protein
VVNVGVNKKGFRLETTDGEVRFQTTPETTFRRGANDTTFSQLQEGQRLRVQARRSGEEWIALRVTIQ